MRFLLDTHSFLWWVTDTQGHILKVVINFQDYERIIETIEDEGLYRAMMKVKQETPLSFQEALAELEKDDR